MSIRPYARSPDRFWLVLGAEVKGLTAAPFETPHGPTDEILSFHEQTLIGRLRDGAPAGRVFIQLTPTLAAHRQYPWPALPAFRSALSTLMDSGVPFQLGCEQDADQAPVERLGDASAASRAVSDVIEFCDGRRDTCPSFRCAFGLSI